MASHRPFMYDAQKNGFYDFHIVFAKSDLLNKNLTERSECLAESGNEAVIQQVLLSFKQKASRFICLIP